MATDQETSEVLAEPAGASVIENELPTYRAISPRAVFALICGFLALFSLAHSSFYVFAILAVLLGFSADRNIQRHPDMLTGRGLARAGAAMGLVFGLGIFTVTSIQGYFVSQNAARYAHHYANLLKSGGLGDVMLQNIPPNQRGGMTGSDVLEKMSKATREDNGMIEMKNAPIKHLKRRVEQKDQAIGFVELEAEGSEGLTHFALALYEVSGPATKEFPEREEHALAVMKGVPSENNGMDWWIEEVRYPYKPKSAVVPASKPADDGHGHAH